MAAQIAQIKHETGFSFQYENKMLFRIEIRSQSLPERNRNPCLITIVIRARRCSPSFLRGSLNVPCKIVWERGFPIASTADRLKATLI
jgi:hypothetical protein